MASIKEEAEKALKAAEKRFKAQDLKGARSLALEAEALFPSLPGLPQSLAAYDVHIAACRRSWNTAGIDWYAVLGIDPSADCDTIKKQYKKMCILTHPDKNPSAAADGAFKLVRQAWAVLSVVCPSDPRACPDCLKVYTVSCVEGWQPLVFTCAMQSKVRVTLPAVDCGSI